MPSLPGSLRRTVATIERRAGEGGRGALFDSPAALRVYVEDETTLTRAKTGEETGGKVTMQTAASADVSAGDVVTIDGVRLTVIAVARHRAGRSVTHLTVVAKG
jgi:hypothetical protein